MCPQVTRLEMQLNKQNILSDWATADTLIIMRVRSRLDRSTVEISQMKRHCNRKSSNDNEAKHFV